ncbi:MAG: DNA polymerase IV [Armatimonadota bacterium]
MQRTILYVNVDAFFASVEQKLRPEHAGRSVVVGELEAPRGVVSSASREAGARGVAPGIPLWRARQRCPDAVLLPVNMRAYEAEAESMLSICERFSPCVESLTVGEAFVDATGSLRMFGGAEAIARDIQRAVAEELSLTASVAVGPSKLVAKMISRPDGPGALRMVGPDELPGVLDDLPVCAIWTVGDHVHERLRRLGVRTVAELRRIPFFALAQEFGKAGRRLHDAARGTDQEPVRPTHGSRPSDPAGAVESVDQEINLGMDTADVEPLRLSLLALSEQVAARLRREGRAARAVTLRLTCHDSQMLTRTAALPDGTNLDDVIYRAAEQLLSRAPLQKRVRCIGISVGRLREGRQPSQMSLFDARAALQTQLSEAKDRLRDRYGRAAVTRASLLRPRRAARVH